MGRSVLEREADSFQIVSGCLPSGKYLPRLLGETVNDMLPLLELLSNKYQMTMIADCHRTRIAIAELLAK